MVSHGFSLAGGYACLTVMQTSVGEPRFALAVQGCLVCCVYAWNWRELCCQGVFAYHHHTVCMHAAQIELQGLQFMFCLHR